MKNIIVFFVLTLTISFISSFSYAYDCPFGLVNDPAPGQCGRFIDSDNSGFCDHSQTLAQNTQPSFSNQENMQQQSEDPNELITGQELKTKTVAEVAQIYAISVDEFIKQLKQQFSISQITSDSSFQLLHDNYGVQPNVVKQIASSLVQGTPIQIQTTSSIAKPVAKSDRYNFGIISSITILLYAISWLLSYKKVYSVVTHRKMWNSLLGIHFFGTAFLGILLVLRVTYGFTLPLPFNILFWHVEAGIVFALIALFHITWHWPYIKAIFVKPKGKR